MFYRQVVRYYTPSSGNAIATFPSLVSGKFNNRSTSKETQDFNRTCTPELKKCWVASEWMSRITTVDGPEAAGGVIDKSRACVAAVATSPTCSIRSIVPQENHGTSNVNFSAPACGSE